MRLLLLALGISLITGCVSNKSVQTVQAGDESLSCEALRSELASLGAKFEDAKDDSGITGKNVGLALVFWPGIIVNEVRANKNQDSIDSRVSHLSSIYNRKCTGGADVAEPSADPAERLKELKALHDEGLITDEEYEAARRRAVEAI